MNSVFLNNQQLADKGWEKMSTLLDKEMPQPRKRRPIFWWMAAAAVLAGITVYFRQEPNVPVPPPETNNDHSAPAAGQHQPSAGLPAHAGSYAAPGSMSVTGSTVARSVVPSPNAADHHQFLSKNGALTTPEYTTPVLPTTAVAAPEVHNNSAYNAVAAPEVRNTPEHTAVISPATTADVISSAGLSLLPHTTGQPELALTLPVLEPVELTPVLTKLHKKRRQATATFGLTAGASALQVKQVPGFIGGITVDLLHPRKKIGLQTGILYRYLVFSGESRPVIPVSYDRYVRATANYDIQPKDFPNSWLYLSANNSVLVPVMKSHQLEMPMMVFWQPFSRWRLYGGMSVLRHVWVKSAEKSLFTYDLQVVTTPDDKAAGNLNNVITGQLPAWEKNWQTGFSFRPMKHLELGLFYRATWQGKPLLSDASRLFDTCNTCSDNYPTAEQRTTQSLRPQSLQLNATIKF